MKKILFGFMVLFASNTVYADDVDQLSVYDKKAHHEFDQTYSEATDYIDDSLEILDKNLPQLAGPWYISGAKTFVHQYGAQLVFINEHGSLSRGYFLSNTEVVAIDWGNLRGSLSGGNTVIIWHNGTYWYR
ncbi:hypothetical protein [Aliikangiella coralliicola]|uniref:Uncharacterized protein n=1 Tax=Aliikangiella coralliicola TaxID=2592383 RepID=A0A545UFW3_9GAMM|nr:hypothetical protein [Aliikangiella coralliicola]TQV88335.1 hypothetical protein FLL46_07360 [Aliikangiella coralliicola]